MATEREVTDALASVRLPGAAGDPVSAGLVSGLAVKDGHVQFAIETGEAGAERMEPVRRAAEQVVGTLPGVLSVTAVLTAHKASAPQREAGRAPARDLLPQVGAIVAVASGKGGVGKSTTAANLAISFRAMGLRTAMLDADIYGPSLPTMMGASGRPSSPDGKTIIPMEAHGVTCMSIGFMVAPDAPTIWRGPMVMGALEQMMGDVQWGPQDVLVVDMPPGTGDVQMTLTQTAEVTGVIIVSTPQDVALLDARKGVDMFSKMSTPILGMIENMSIHVCSKCGHEEHMFGHGGVRAVAEKLGLPLLAEIPLDLDIRSAADGGAPIVVSKPASPRAGIFRDVARTLIADGNA